MKTVKKFASALLLLGNVSYLLGAEPARADTRRPECAQLEALRSEYAGRTLTSEQRAFKVKATLWYSINCRTRRAER